MSRGVDVFITIRSTPVRSTKGFTEFSAAWLTNPASGEVKEKERTGFLSGRERHEEGQPSNGAAPKGASGFPRSVEETVLARRIGKKGGKVRFFIAVGKGVTACWDCLISQSSRTTRP